VNRVVDSILEICRTKPVKEKAHYQPRVGGLLPLCGCLDAARAARVADEILAVLGNDEAVGLVKRGPTSPTAIAEALASVAERLEPPGTLRVATELVRVLQKANEDRLPSEPFRIALMSVCRRLDATGVARVAGAIVAAVRDPATSVEGRTAFASVLVAVGDRLDPVRADSLERAIVDSLVADMIGVKSLSFFSTRLLSQSLAALCGRPGAKSAARVADALTETICNPQTPIVTLEPLVRALVAVGVRLPPKDASSRADRVIAVLDTLRRTRTKSLERMILAEALAAAWTGLGPTEASDHARRMATDLGDLLRDPKLLPFEQHRLARALAVVYRHLDPAERAAHANAIIVPHANTILATLRDPNNNLSLGTFSQFSEALVALCMLLDRPEAVRVFDALLTILSDPVTQRYQPATQRYHLDLQEESTRIFLSRLDEADLRRLLEPPLAVGGFQRTILEVLGEAKQCSFRNTWDYLDRTAAPENATGVPAARPND
jgi:hypothetical protein